MSCVSAIRPSVPCSDPKAKKKEMERSPVFLRRQQQWQQSSRLYYRRTASGTIKISMMMSFPLAGKFSSDQSLRWDDQTRRKSDDDERMQLLGGVFPRFISSLFSNFDSLGVWFSGKKSSSPEGRSRCCHVYGIFVPRGHYLEKILGCVFSTAKLTFQC